MRSFRPSPLRLARWSTGLTLLDVQLATGIPSTKLSLAERGLTHLSSCEGTKIAAAIGAPEEALLEYSEVPG